MPSPPDIPPALTKLCQAELGALDKTTFCGWDHAESRVWEVVSRRGERAFLKQHRQAHKFVQERRAYLEWCPKLGPRVPHLLAARLEEPRALLLSALPGQVLESLPDAPQTEAYRQAGALLNKLHTLPCQDDNPLTLEGALEERLAVWSQRGKGVVGEATMDWVRGRALEALPHLASQRRVPCHRDYTARNWLWRENQLFIIDFEHARPDLWLLDLQRLWSGVWPERPDLRKAFMSGYGRELGAEEAALLSRLAALEAMTTVIWAHEHEDEPFEAYGWRTLERLRAGAC